MAGKTLGYVSGQYSQLVYIPPLVVDYLVVAGGGAGSGVFGLTAIDIFSYAGSTFKTALSNQNIDNNSTGWVFRSVGLWRSTSAITSLTITNSSNQLAAGTTASLYGILKA